MVKNYQRFDLKKYFEENLSQTTIDSQYYPILVEILMRRAYEFELTPEEIQSDMEAIQANLTKITVGKMPKGFERTLGIYDPSQKEIRISNKYVKSYDAIDLYEITTHELYHVLSRDNNCQDRLGGFNRYTGQYNGSLLEAIVEKAADRATFDRRTRDKPYFCENIIGYSDITFITDVLEATYGVSQKELLSKGIKGRDRLAEYLSKSSNENVNETMRFLDEVEVNYARLHNTLYPTDKSHRLKPEEKQKNIEESLKGIYRSCENKFAQRMENKEFASLEEGRHFIEDCKYNYNKLYFTMDHAIDRIKRIHNIPNLKQEIEKEVMFSRGEVSKRISDTDSVLKNKSNMPQDKIYTLARWARYGNLLNYGKENLDKLGINIDRETIFFLQTYVINMYIKKDFSEEKWPNHEEIIDYTKKLYKNESKPLKRIIRGAKSTWNNMKQSFSLKKIFEKKDNKSLLGTSEDNKTWSDKENIKKLQNNFAELSKEELKKFNEGSKKVIENFKKKELDVRKKEDGER